ncbi:MAG TPA: amidohydrolase family protein [Thermoplasmata archaeon]|nr:amidohydrolase family protein [Thermoplasmata archaeon]
MDVLAGAILSEAGFARGSVSIENGVVVEVSKRIPSDPLATGVVIPAFTNGHTHVADAIVQEELTGSLEDIVAPPRGLKHRALDAATDEDLVDGMRSMVRGMARMGVARFCDFREGGLPGARLLLRAALGGAVVPTVLGRPARIEYRREEVDAILRVTDGIGISSALDWPRDEVEKLAAHTRRAGKAFAAHCSERVREDIDAVLDLRPAFLVHMVEATDADLERTADAGVAVVACPRSNVFFGKVPDLPRFLRHRLAVHLGTDNAMVNSPSVLREMEFAYKVSRLRGGIGARDVLTMALRGRNGFTGPPDIGIRVGDPADLVVFDLPHGGDVTAALLKAAESDIALVYLRGHAWARKPSPKVAPRKERRSLPRSRGKRAR